MNLGPLTELEAKKDAFVAAIKDEERATRYGMVTRYATVLSGFFLLCMTHERFPKFFFLLFLLAMFVHAIGEIVCSLLTLRAVRRKLNAERELCELLYERNRDRSRYLVEAISTAVDRTHQERTIDPKELN